MSITRSAFDRQMSHIGNVRHGVATGPWRVEFDAKVADDAANLKIKQGSVVHLNESGAFTIGVPTRTPTSCSVPCISLKNVSDADVTTGMNTTSNPALDKTVSAMGSVITAIPVTSGYELETTEFVAEDKDKLKVGTFITAGTDGKVKACTAGTEVIIGVVSKAPAPDYLNNTRVAFFATFLPAGVGAGAGA